MSDGSAEHWKPVLSYEDCYEVSDQGRVRSLDRRVYAGRNATRLSRGRILTPGLSPTTGRRLVNLCRDGHRLPRPVATLVAEAFLGARPDGLQVCHNNGCATDDRLVNLRWDTASANILDQTRHGTHNNARKTHCPRGHEYSGENLLLDEGRRRCVLCTRQSGRERAQRSRERAARIRRSTSS